MPTTTAYTNAAFVTKLEQCIRHNAASIAASAMDWSDRCQSISNKMDSQVARMRETLDPIFHEFGYSGALWCAFYTAKMNDYPYYADWRNLLFCPYNADDSCHGDEIGVYGDERDGVPAGWGNAAYMHDGDFDRDEWDTRAMSCGLCGHLSRTFGNVAPYRMDFPAEYHNSPRLQMHRASAAGGSCSNFGDWCQGWWNEWDMHAFGAWLATVTDPADVAATMYNVHRFRVTNGEEVHGFIWETIRQLNKNETRRARNLDRVDYAIEACRPSTDYSRQTRLDCIHAMGHGFFYWHMEELNAGRNTVDGRSIVNAAMRDCLETSYREWDDMMQWMCASGVTHSATNSIGTHSMAALVASGSNSWEFVCAGATDAWYDDAHYDECICVSALGLADADARQGLVGEGYCEAADTGNKPWLYPTLWEQQQLNKMPWEKKKSARALRTRRARRMLRKGAVRIGDDGHDMDEDGYDVDVDDAAEMVQEAGLTGGQDDDEEEEEASAQLEEAQQQQPPARPRAVMVANLDYELD